MNYVVILLKGIELTVLQGVWFITKGTAFESEKTGFEFQQSSY